MKYLKIIIIIIGIMGFYPNLNIISNEELSCQIPDNTNDPLNLEISQNIPNLIDGRYYTKKYFDGYYDYGLKTIRGVQTYLSWDNDYKLVKTRTIKYHNYSVNNTVNYVVDCGRFKLEFGNFSNTITTSRFSFSQKPSEIGLYNWNTEIYINKQNVSKANEIIPHYENKTLTYTDIFTNTDVKFISNSSHIKEVFINDGTVFWAYPNGWDPNDTYLVISTELFNIKGIKIYDNDGEINQTKIINGLIKLKSTEIGKEILAYLPLGNAWSKFDDNEFHYIPVKSRIVFRDNKIYYVNAIKYNFVKNISRIGKLYIDPTWVIGKDGDAWANCKFFQTMENKTTHYAHLYPNNSSGYIKSPIGIAKLQWLRIQYDGNLHGGKVDIYWNYSHDLISWNLELVKLNAKSNIDYYFDNPSKYGRWLFVLEGTSSPFTTPEIFNITVFNDPPNDDDFEYYKEIEIDANKVSGLTPHDNFSILIDIEDDDLQNNAQNDGDDIAFSNDTHWLDHEIEFWDGSISNHLIAWVRIPSLNPLVNTTIFMYYGNDTMGPQENPTGVWDSDYIMTQHLEDLTTSTTDDSTSYNNDGVKAGANEPIEIDGKIYKAQDFDGSNDYIDFDSAINDFTAGGDLTDDATVSLWVYRHFSNTVGTDQAVFWCYQDSYDRVYIQYRASTDQWRFRHEGGNNNVDIHLDADIIPQNIWTYVVMTWDVSGNALKVYVNGSQQLATGTGLSSCDTPNTLYIGKSHEVGDEYNGLIDEHRLLISVKSADWILTEYNNQYDPSTFYSIGEQTPTIPLPPLSTTYFAYYKEIIIDASKVYGSGSHLNFPILININDTDIQDHTQSDGDDIAFYNGTIWLDHEIEYYNGSESNNLVIWVRIPSLSTSVNTTIYLYYGNDTMGNYENPTGVWDNYYKGVYHLSESSGNVIDSTAYDNDGTNNGATREISGQIHYCYDFESSQSDYIRINDDNSLDISQAITISSWIKVESYGIEGFGTIVDKDWESGYSFGVHNSTDETIDFSCNDAGIYEQATNDAINENIWFYVVITYDKSNVRFYVNGELDDSDPESASILTNNKDVLIGSGWDGLSIYYDYDGLIDEVRISNISRSGDWIKTKYSNQYEPSAFYSIGEEQEIEEVDEDPPTWDTLTESEDPLELGNNETININVYDDSNISFVYLEFDDTNHSMTNIYGNTYQYSNWLPSKTGIHNYSIWMGDNETNINWTGIFNITVIDTTKPNIFDVIESDDPLELGNNETITCNITDLSTILFVYLEFDDTNHSMTNIYGNTYQYSNWLPNATGLYNYTIWTKDNETNIANYSGDITVIEIPIIPTIVPNAILAIIVMFFLMGLMIFFYTVNRRWIIMLTIFLFSIIFGVIALSQFQIPFSPYFQLFFIIFQSIFFLLVSKDAFYKTKKNRWL